MGLGRRLGAVVLGVVLAVAGPRAASAQDEPLVVRQLDFVGNHAISSTVLANSIVTTNSSSFASSGFLRWMGLGTKRYFNERDFEADVLRLRILYRKSGFPDAEVDTLVRRDPENVYVTVKIQEGRPILVDSLQITGLDTLPPDARSRVAQDLPLRRGDVFNRYLMQASADTLKSRLRDHGYPAADVFTSFSSQAAQRTASVTLDVVPGPRSYIGPIRVEGDRRVDSQTVIDLLAARPGRRYSQQEIFQSQRNLYDADLFRFASVGIDSAALVPGRDTVPLRVRVAEAPPLRLRTGVGYGTTDCFRATAQATYRNFLGNGRLLDVSARTSKVGVGGPLDWGLERQFLCSTLLQDSVGSRLLNYNLTTSLRRPAFLSPSNTLTLSGFTERRSEFKVYRRQETGATIGISRLTPRRRIPLSLTYTVSVGRTDASRATFCAYLRACDVADVELLSQRRGFAALTGTGNIPRVNNLLDPSRGSIYSLETTWASKLIGSSSFLQFFRVLATGSWYTPLSRDVVLSARLRGGLIFSPQVALTSGTAAFVPPEQRFYAGGPNDVRGFNRNELGPVAYVVTKSAYDQALGKPGGGLDSLSTDSIQVVPTGGNSYGVGNVELRFPSPVFSERLRLAAFVDVGALWERGATDSTGARSVAGTINPRITPGVGLRIVTPLGPARLDVAYNPSSLQPGLLYVTDPENGSISTPTTYQLTRRRHFTFHFAVGPAF